VEPGVLNLDVTKHVSAAGHYYAPDPSSQSICSIGGNVAENSGGAHCLKYGFTVNHVLGARVVLDDGRVVDFGGPVLDAPGHDLLAVLVGSEGMCGIVTEVTLRLLRRPEAGYDSLMTLPGSGEAVADRQVVEQLEIQAKYQGYIERQMDEVERNRSQETLPLPADLDYREVRGLSIEVQQKLSQHRPETLGQASRVQGVTPAAISLLLVHLKRGIIARNTLAKGAANEEGGGGEPRKSA